MTKVLQIDSSIFGSNGNSSQLTAKFVQQLQEAAEKIEVTYRNVGVSDFPHYSAQTVEDVGAGCAELADLLIAEVQTADILVLGVPMYNFGVPSQLKSWFDHIARAGSTFKYTESGPVGLLQNKKAYVLAAHGGLHHEAQSTDVESEFLKTFLGFVGITDQSFIYADGLNMAQHSEANRARAEREISEAVKALAASLGKV